MESFLFIHTGAITFNLFPPSLLYLIRSLHPICISLYPSVYVRVCTLLFISHAHVCALYTACGRS